MIGQAPAVEKQPLEVLPAQRPWHYFSVENLSLLLVEDEARLADKLRRGLGEEGFARVNWTDSAEAAEAELHRNSYDLIVLDLRLPGKDGLDFLRQLRARQWRRGADSDRPRIASKSASPDWIAAPMITS